MIKIRKLIKIFYKKVRNFIRDDFGGNLVEYALLIGFALFVFFILVGVITSILNWTLGLSNDFFDIIGGIGG
jgi:Flp pilus assembly pilin Flp